MKWDASGPAGCIDLPKPPDPPPPPVAAATPTLPPAPVVPQSYQPTPAPAPEPAPARRAYIPPPSDIVLGQVDLDDYLNTPDILGIALNDPQRREIVIANLVIAYSPDTKSIATFLADWRTHSGNAPKGSIEPSLIKSGLTDPNDFTMAPRTMAWVIWSYHADVAKIVRLLNQLRGYGPNPS